MQRFIPARDDVLFDRRPPADRLVPYQVGMPCLHWEAVIATPGGEERVLGVIEDPASADRRAERRGPRRCRP